MAILVVLIIMVVCAALQYVKGTLVRALASVIVAIFALIVAFGFFEFLAGFIIGYAEKGITASIVNFAQPICFALLFVIVFAALQSLSIYLTRDEVDMGEWAEKIGRPVCGVVLGFIVSGALVTVLAMSPLPSKYPYERFEESNLKLSSPNKLLLSPDGFVTGLFNTISGGSLSGKRGFAVLHPNFLDQVFLNRINKNVSILTSTAPAISIPVEKAVWQAPEAIKSQIEDLNSKGELSTTPGKPSGAYTPMVVRVGIKRSALKNEEKISAGKFTASQLRLICKPSTELQNPLRGKAINVYPAGYLTAQDQMQAFSEIQLDNDSFGEGSSKEIDFVFCLPTGYTPVLVEFKINSVAQISSGAILKDASEVPEAATFRQSGSPDGGMPGQGSGR